VCPARSACRHCVTHPASARCDHRSAAAVSAACARRDRPTASDHPLNAADTLRWHNRRTAHAAAARRAGPPRWGLEFRV
jgi:hypothetical protein